MCSGQSVINSSVNPPICTRTRTHASVYSTRVVARLCPKALYRLCTGFLAGLIPVHPPPPPPLPPPSPSPPSSLPHSRHPLAGRCNFWLWIRTLSRCFFKTVLTHPDNANPNVVSGPKVCPQRELHVHGRGRLNACSRPWSGMNLNRAS